MPIRSFCFPAAGYNIWRGGFKISNTGGFYGGFKVQPSYSIYHREFESVKRMPIVLEVSLLPRDLSIPDFLEVFLYFFPCEEDERSTKNFSSLFELLETEKSILRGCVGDMELLIFTSKQIPPEYQEEAASSIREQFLWGINIRHQNKSCTSLNLSSSIDTEVLNAGGSNADLDRENRTNNAQVTEDE